jgi:protein LSM14
VLKKVKIKDEDGSEEIKDVSEERESDERAPLPSPDKFYDRSKSFFDNILCEAMPPRSEEEIMTRRQEQALNTETFGSSAAHYRPAYRGRGRGRGRWRGGRGFHRGRGNFRGNSNRRWVDYEFDYEAAGITKNKQHQPKQQAED